MTGPDFAKPPRLNHVALSVPADRLDADGRAALTAFYGDVFGFEEYAGALRLHSFYVRYRLPLMVETQHFEYLF